MVIEKVVGLAIMKACDSLEVKKEHDPPELDNKIFEVKKEIGEPQLLPQWPQLQRTPREYWRPPPLP